MVSHSHWRCWRGMHEVEQRNIMCQEESSHNPCPLRASRIKPTLWSGTACAIYSHFHRSWVGCDPNATWEFLGVISSWYYWTMCNIRLMILSAFLLGISWWTENRTVVNLRLLNAHASSISVFCLEKCIDVWSLDCRISINLTLWCISDQSQ